MMALPTIEICIDDGEWELGKCCRTNRYANTPNQIQNACRSWSDQWKAVNYPVLGVFWRHIGSPGWTRASV